MTKPSVNVDDETQVKQVTHNVLKNNIDKYTERPTSLEAAVPFAKKIDLNPSTTLFASFDELTYIQFHAWFTQRRYGAEKEYTQAEYDTLNDLQTMDQEYVIPEESVYTE